MVKGKPSPEQIIDGLGKRHLYGVGVEPKKPDGVDEFTWDLVQNVQKNMPRVADLTSDHSQMPAVKTEEDLVQLCRNFVQDDPSRNKRFARAKIVRIAFTGSPEPSSKQDKNSFANWPASPMYQQNKSVRWCLWLLSEAGVPLTQRKASDSDLISDRKNLPLGIEASGAGIKVLEQWWNILQVPKTKTYTKRMATLYRDMFVIHK